MDNGASSYRRFLDGEESAFDEILDLYQENLIFFINRFVHNLTVAEDLAADAFAALIMHPRRYNFTVTLKTYLFMIGRSRALDWLKHEAKLKIIAFDGLSNVSAEYLSLEERVIADERKRRVNEALERLRDDYKTAVHLVYFEDMSYEEAAKVMKKNRKQIENLVYRAKNALRADLGKEGADL